MIHPKLFLVIQPGMAALCVLEMDGLMLFQIRRLGIAKSVAVIMQVNAVIRSQIAQTLMIPVLPIMSNLVGKHQL